MAKPKPKTKKTAPRKAKRPAPEKTHAGIGQAIIEVPTYNGKVVYRLFPPSSEYNKDGLVLDGIDMALFDAFNPEGDRDLLDEQILRETGEDAAVHVRLFCSADEDENGYDVCDAKQYSCPRLNHLIQPDDARLAKLIRAAPLALLRSFDAQDALARWTYAVRHCHDPETRASAKKLLGTALPPKGRGPRGKADPDLPQLLQAYDDLCCYVKLLYACAEAQAQRHPTKADARTPEAVADGVRQLLEHFPDAEALRDSGVVLEEIVRPEIKGPGPSDVAAAYISRRHGLSSSRVMDIVAKAKPARGPSSAFPAT